MLCSDNTVLITEMMNVVGVGCWVLVVLGCVGLGVCGVVGHMCGGACHNAHVEVREE